MKKLLLTCFMLFGAGSLLATAQEVEKATPAVQQAAADSVVKIDLSDIPSVVQQAISTTYPECTIKEAYVSEKDGAKLYKIVLTSKEGEEIVAILNEKGEKVS